MVKEIGKILEILYAPFLSTLVALEFVKKDFLLEPAFQHQEDAIQEKYFLR